jgi:hypothetical protein
MKPTIPFAFGMVCQIALVGCRSGPPDDAEIRRLCERVAEVLAPKPGGDGDDLRRSAEASMPDPVTGGLDVDCADYVRAVRGAQPSAATCLAKCIRPAKTRDDIEACDQQCATDYRRRKHAEHEAAAAASAKKKLGRPCARAPILCGVSRGTRGDLSPSRRHLTIAC